MKDDFNKLTQNQKYLIWAIVIIAFISTPILLKEIERGTFDYFGFTMFFIISHVFFGFACWAYFGFHKKRLKAEELESEGKYLEAVKLYKEAQMFPQAQACWEKYCEKKKAEAMISEKEGFLEEALKIYREIESEEDIERLENILMNINNEEKLLKAKKYEEAGKLEYAQIIYQQLGMTEESDRLERLEMLNKAKRFEKETKFREAALIYETLNMWEDAKRCMKQL
ncbi:MAG: hypothetical protein PHV06_00290 [bacterium]|nr:hypothetical protein [bacterium]